VYDCLEAYTPEFGLAVAVGYHAWYQGLDDTSRGDIVPALDAFTFFQNDVSDSDAVCLESDPPEPPAK
jgi:hypothetical protein